MTDRDHKKMATGAYRRNLHSSDGELNARGVRALAETALPGETVIRHFDAALVPCGCVTHRISGVDCAVVARGAATGRYGREHHYRCLRCGVTWVAWHNPNVGCDSGGDAP